MIIQCTLFIDIILIKINLKLNKCVVKYVYSMNKMSKFGPHSQLSYNQVITKLNKEIKKYQNIVS